MSKSSNDRVVLREHHLLLQPIINTLQHRDRPAWEIEDELAKVFNVTPAERALIHPGNRCPVWRNDVAFGLSRLVQAKVILSVGKRQAPPGHGGRRNVYRLAKRA